jgi:hypothetical protein
MTQGWKLLARGLPAADGCFFPKKAAISAKICVPAIDLQYQIAYTLKFMSIGEITGRFEAASWDFR